MAKCISCDKKIKFSRQCPALNGVICSSCCGSKKGLEIECVSDCKYFVEGAIKQNKKQIMQLVKQSFNREEDIYQDSRMLKLIGPFEEFIFENYYNNTNVTDDFITDCYTKIFYSLDGKGNIYTFNEIEKEIFNMFNKNAKKTKMPVESQKLILIRMMKTVDNVTGGRFGNRMYLELLRNDFTGTGTIAEIMDKM